MVEEQRVFSVKIATIRETLVKLGKAVRTDLIPSVTDGEFEGFTDRTHSFASCLDSPKPTDQSSIVRSRGNSVKSQLPETNLPDTLTRNGRDQVEMLLQRIADKDKLLKEQSTHIVQLQDAVERLKTAALRAKLEAESEKTALEGELSREKSLRKQVELKLQSALAEETKKAKAGFPANEAAWRSDLAALQSRLEDANAVKVTLMESNAELMRQLQAKEFETLKLREECRDLGTKLQRKSAQEEQYIAELQQTHSELLSLRKHTPETHQSPTPSFPSEPSASLLQAQIAELRDQLVRVTSERDNVYLELSGRPTHKQLRERDSEIAELRSLLGETRRTTASLSSPRSHREHQPRVLKGQGMTEVMNILKVKSAEDAVAVVQRLAAAHASTQRLISRLTALVRECSHAAQPSHKEIWQWTRRLAEDYMKVRKTMDGQREVEEVANKLVEMLGLTSPTELPKRIATLLEETALLVSIADRMKPRLSLSPQTSLQELSQHLA